MFENGFKSNFKFLGIDVSRTHLGVPENWNIVRNWITEKNRIVQATCPQKPSFTVKCPEITELDSYEKTPSHTFWNKFPKNIGKKTCSTPINVKKFEDFINTNSSSWSYQQKAIAKKAVKTLKFGSKICFKKNLKVNHSNHNGKSALKHGKLITDTIATWVKKGYVIGPFSSPPFEDLHISPLMATEQKTKVRPILNLSAPVGFSLNDSVNKIGIRKLTMSSAKKFSQTLLQLGRNAVFAKSDLVDAYKLIPIHPSNWKYYGFKWLGKFFIDTTTPFGSNTAPANFDDVGETLANIVKTICKTPKQLIHRQLDDVPVIAPEFSKLAGNFSDTYKKVCKSLNIEMAPQCVNKEKAFDETKTGTVLGIEFNSENLSWRLPNVKYNDSIWILNEFLEKNTCTLLDLQKLHGKINDFAQLCPFIKGFKFHQNKMLQEFEISKKYNMVIPKELKNELKIWKNCIADNYNSFPIPKINEEIPMFFTENFSDAAGAAFTKNDGKNPIHDERGAASITIINQKIRYCTKTTWSYEFLCKFPHNSALLELIGVILPFVSHPKLFVNKYVKCNVDNISLGFAWINKTVKTDSSLYEIFQILHLIEYAIPCKIFIEHSPRRSSWQTILVDNLTRKNTTLLLDENLIKNAEIHELYGPLKNWINSPNENLNVIEVIDYITNKL